MTRSDRSEHLSALAPLERFALQRSGATCLVVDWDGVRVAVFGQIPAGGLPELEVRAASQWISCVLQADAPALTGRLWALHGDTLDAARLREVAEMLAPALALQSERDSLAGKLRHVERAVRAANVGLWEWDVSSGHAYSGNNWPALLGYAPGDVEMSYAGWAALVHPEDLPATEEALRAFLDAIEPVRLRVEYRLRHRSGEWCWTLSLGDVVRRWPDGTPRLVAGTHQDIRAQKTSALALAESEAYAKSLFHSSPDRIEVIGVDGVLLDVSEGGLRLLGAKSRDQLVGVNWPQLWPQPHDREAAVALASVAAGNTYRFRGACPIDGKTRWWDVFAAPLRDADGTIRRALVTSRDVSDQVGTEQELRQVTAHMEELVSRQTAELRDSEGRLRSILSNLDGMTYRWRAAPGRETFFVSEGAQALLGVAPQAVDSADTLLDRFVCEEDRQHVREAWEIITEAGVHEHEFRIVDAQGRQRWVHERLCLVHAGDQATGCVDAVLRDVTERREMSRALALANHTLEESLAAVFWLDEHGGGLRANRATAQLVGYSREELQRLDLTCIHPDLGGERWTRLREAIDTRGPQQLHLTLQHRSGGALPVCVLITAVMFEGKQIYVGFANDESRQLEDQRARRDSDLLSRAALGALSSRIAILDCTGMVLATNRAWEQRDPAKTDSPPAVVGSNWLDRLGLSRHPSAAAVRAGVLDVVLEREQTFELEYVYAGEEDAAPVWMQLRATRFGTGDDLRVVVAIADISRHKRTELALNRSRQLFETLCGAAPVVIFHTDADGSCRYISSHWDALTGRSVSEDLGFGWLHAIESDDRPRFRSQWAETQDGSGNFVAECRLRRADGVVANVYIQAVKLHSADGQNDQAGWVGTITDLTEIKMATTELARVEQRQREVLQSLPVFVYVLRPASGNLEPIWLSAATDQFGHSFDDGLPDSSWWAEHVHPDDVGRVFAQFQAALGERHRWSYEYRLRRADGSYAWVADHLHAIRDDEGQLLEVIGCLIDVSDRYATEAAFRDSEARLRVAFEQAAVGMAHLEGGVVMRPNRRLLDMTGRAERDFAPEAWSAWTHPEDRERDAALLQDLLGGSAAAGSLDKRLLRTDGSDVWVHVAYSVVECDRDQTPRIFAVVEDTSERRRIHGAATQALFTLDAIAEATFSFDPTDLRFFYVNEGATRQSTYPRTELLSTTLLDLQDPSMRPRIRQLLASAASRPDKGHRLETELVRRDGSRLPVEMAVQYIDSAEQAPFYVAVTRDITERRVASLRLEQLNAELEQRVEQRTDALHATNLLLRNKEEQIRAIVENIPNCVITIDRDGIITSANAAVTAVFDLAVSGAVGRDLDELIPGLFGKIARADVLDRSLHPASGSVLFKGALNGLTAGGELRALEISVGSYELRGEPHYAAIIRDVREEREAQQDLLRARTEAEQANRAKSAFLATMSHEIRTPMNGVLGMSELLLQSSLPRNEREMVETIQQSASTLLDLLDDILDFSKIEAGKLDLEVQPVALEKLIEAVCATHLAVAEAKGVELRGFVAPSTPETIQADPVRVRQILHNLISNAIKFSSGRVLAGHVDVRVAAHEQPDRSLKVTLEIRDNGIGMTQEVLGRVFNPFAQAEGATTRRFGGTGLGLSICKRLVELLEGEIACHSEPGQGTVFTITLRFGEGRWTPCAVPRPAIPLRALVVSSDLVFRTDVLACLRTMQIPHEAFSSGEDMAHWLDREHGGGTESLIISGPEIGNWRQLGRMAVAACDRELPQVVWAPCTRQDEGAEAAIVLVGRTVVSMRTLEQAMAKALGQQPTDAASPARPVEAQFEGESIRLLIAEDHDINQRVIQRQLHRLGIRGDIAGDGEQALAAWRRGGYDAVLADLHMPRMDGYTLASTIRQEEARKGLSRIPIIAFTANAIIGDNAKCFEAGMDDVITKPAELERLREVLTQWLLSPSLLKHDASDGSGSLSGRGTPDSHMDVRVLQQLVGDAPEVVAEFLDEFRQGADRLMHALHTMVPTPEWRNARGAAHRLKSSARSVGATDMGNLSEYIENLAGDAQTSPERVAAKLVELEKEWMLVAKEIAIHLGEQA